MLICSVVHNWCKTIFPWSVRRLRQLKHMIVNTSTINLMILFAAIFKFYSKHQDLYTQHKLKARTPDSYTCLYLVYTKHTHTHTYRYTQTLTFIHWTDIRSYEQKQSHHQSKAIQMIQFVLIERHECKFADIGSYQLSYLTLITYSLRSDSKYEQVAFEQCLYLLVTVDK